MSFFNPEFTETILSGSHTNFKKFERPTPTYEQYEKQLETEEKLKLGIIALRKLKTATLLEQSPAIQQEHLKKAHHLAKVMAQDILEHSKNPFHQEITTEFIEETSEIKQKLEHIQDINSGYSISAGYPTRNLKRAAEDILVRLKETVGNLDQPSHKISEEEAKYIFNEFLRGTNSLTIDAIEKFFNSDTKIAGILSGGSIYLEMVKIILEKYGTPEITPKTFIVATDQKAKKTIFEVNQTDKTTTNVILTDDVINKGGTLTATLWSTGEIFPNATIYSGVGSDLPGGFQKRKDQAHKDYLFDIYQDFADLSEEGKYTEALVIFETANKYALENNITLSPGWYKRKKRIEDLMK